MRRASIALLALAVVLAALAITPAAGADDHVVRVTTGANDGAGSFRAAVDAANGDTSVRLISFADGLTVSLEEAVVYTGRQPLRIAGNGGTLDGTAGDATANATWDGGLFVSRSTADLWIANLDMVDSFNNGMAVFVPETARGRVEVRLRDVAITGAKFHGLFVDGQDFDGFNTDDIPHPACEDPHPFDSPASLGLWILAGTISGNGTLEGGFDDTLATGCPRDFDGVRVDDGGAGSIVARFRNSQFDENLADGAELDDTGPGSVKAFVSRSSFDGNGDSGEQADGNQDLDDGFDIDEADGGDLVARVANTSLTGNFDEAVDFDEAGPGRVDVKLANVEADANEDEGVKVDEEDAGGLNFRVTRSSSTNSISQDGVQVGEAGLGRVQATILNSVVTGNDGDGVKVEQEAPGGGSLLVARSDLRDNADDPVATEGIGNVVLIGVLT